MGSSYSDGLTIERIDNNKGYCKSNCKWIKKGAQSRNRRNVILYKGLTAIEGSRKLGFNRNEISKRMRRGWSKQKAFTTPKQ